MKINPLNDAALAAAALGAAKAERGAAPAAGAPKADGIGAGTSVSVSAGARTLGASGVSSGSGIDEAKVAAVRAAIANGTFQVDAGAIADKLLNNAQEFLSRARS